MTLPGVLALAPDGRLFFRQHDRIMVVENDQIALFAGGDHPLQETDGPALVATFLEPIKDLAVGTQGELRGGRGRPPTGAPAAAISYDLAEQCGLGDEGDDGAGTHEARKERSRPGRRTDFDLEIARPM